MTRAAAGDGAVLAELDDRLTALDETLTGLGKALVAEIEERTAALDALAERVGQAEAAAGQLAAWAETATPQQWQELTGWVDWLVTTYELVGDRRVAPCWPSHPGVVEELAALRGAWIVVTAKQPPGDAMVQWHESLHRLLPRVTTVLRGCKDTHSRGSIPRCHDPAAVPQASR